MPTYTMLIGVPGSGKSTWISKQPIDWGNTVLASTDHFIEMQAKAQGKTYSQVFQSEIKAATNHMNKAIADALANGFDVIHDQTNVTAKARRAKLANVPETYRKVAVFFSTPNNAELKRRLDSRAGKTIPANVVIGMASQLEMPTEEEGFDQVHMAG